MSGLGAIGEIPIGGYIVVASGGGGFQSAWAYDDDDFIGERKMKKNVASQAIGAQMVSSTDGSAFTGAVTVSVTGDAGTQATGSVGAGACTHEGNGYHTYAPAQAETNYDLIAFTFTGSGAIPKTVQLYTDFPQTGDAYVRLGAPAGASVSADVAAVKSDSGGIKTKTDSLTFTSAGKVDANALQWNSLTTVALPLIPTVAGRTLDVSATGEAGVDWANVGTPGSTVNLSATTTNLVNTVTTYTGNTVQTGDSFARIGVAGAGLTNIDLPDQTMNITGNITGNLSGSVGSVTGAVGSVTGLTASNLDATISSRLATASYTAPPSAAQNATAVLTTQMTESYAADGVAPTLAQAVFLTQQSLSEFAISGTTISVKKLDGTTEAATFTLDSAATPTSRTRDT